MLRRTVAFGFTLLIGNVFAMPQGPLVPFEIKAGEFLLGILSPVIVEQIKKWLASKPRDESIRKELVNLSNQLNRTSHTRDIFVETIFQYMDVLDGKDADRREYAQREAQMVTVEMLHALTGL